MFTYPVFEVEITRCVDANGLEWPSREATGDDGGLGCNRTYVDLQRFSWADAKRVFRLEQELMAKIVSIANDSESEALEEELFQGERYLYGLDLGIASAVIALSAAKCIPFSSCNAAAFGGYHQERYPLIAFYGRAQMSELLLESAKEADIGLRQNGYLVAYGDDIRKIGRFALGLISRRAQFGAIQIRKPQRRRLGVK